MAGMQQQMTRSTKGLQWLAQRLLGGQEVLKALQKEGGRNDSINNMRFCNGLLSTSLVDSCFLVKPPLLLLLLLLLGSPPHLSTLPAYEYAAAAAATPSSLLQLRYGFATA
jgi:hypothetical protein